MKWIISISILVLYLIGGNTISCRYNDLDILKKKEKVSIDFIFDKDYNYEEQNSQLTFNKYFFTYQDTSLTLVNGARMICRHPQKIDFKEEQLIRSNKLISPQMNQISNLTLDWGYIFFREINNLCFNQVYDKWIYQICPSKKATQILSYNKIDDKTGEEVREINILGYAANDTNLLTDEQLFNQETGMTIDSFMQNYSPLSPKLNITEPAIFIEDRLVKVFNLNINQMDGKKKIILEVKYKLSDLRKLNKPIKVSDSINSIDDYLKDYPDAEEIPISREIIEIINPNLLLLNLEVPKVPSYISYEFKYSQLDQDKDKNKENEIMISNNLIYSKSLNFLNYTNRRYLTIFHLDSYQKKKIIHIHDERLIAIDPPFTSNTLISLKTKKLPVLYFIEDYLIVQGSSLLGRLRNFLIGENTFYIKKPTIKPGDYIYFIKENTPALTLPLFDEIKKCQVKAIVSNNILLLTKGSQCNHNSLNRLSYIIIPSQSDPVLKSNSSITPTDPASKDISFDLNSLKKITLQSPYKEPQNPIIHFKLPNSNITTIQFNLTSIDNKKASYVSLYLTHNESVTKQDYEVLINSQNGVLIKQIGNNDTIAFYTKELINFFVDKTECEILLFNSTIYFNSIDSNTLFFIKVKFLFQSLNTINHMYINRRDSSNLIMTGMNIFPSITKANIIGIFIYEKKYLLNDNVAFYDTFINGDYCEAEKKNRTVQIEYRCDLSGINDLIISKVKEHKLCEYKYVASSKFLCNPHLLMKNVIQSSINQVTCFAQDDNYNKNTHDLFSK